MENKYNIENFERFLREKTDEFKMYPSKRVWYSIYNNMHPGNRLPSVSMCIILICSLFLVGYLNTDTQKYLAANNDTDKANMLLASQYTGTDKEQSSAAVYKQWLTDDLPQNPSIQKANNLNEAIEDQSRDNADIKSIASKYRLSFQDDNKKQAAGRNTGLNSDAAQSNTTVRNVHTTIISPDATVSMNENAGFTTADNEPGTLIKTEKNTASIQSASTVPLSGTATITIGETQENIQGQREKTVNTAVNDIVIQKNTVETTTDTPGADNALSVTTAKVTDIASNSNDVKNTENNATAALTESDKAWIENFAMYNRPVPKKWAGKLSWQAYVTPSAVYRKLYNNTTDKSLSGNGNGNFNNSDVDNTVIQKPSFGIETGLSLQYDLLKWVKVKAGVQLNYTRYNAHAFENQHPISTSLIMNGDDNISAYEIFRSTPYSNTVGLVPIKLHNETYQLSLPFGADVRLFANGKLAWYAGATIQPTIVIYANSYLLSSDRRNYVKDASMLNRFNLNAGFETYISFKTSNYTWQAGPQFRSQIFSTNNKVYSVEERLMNYGFKIGVTKKL